MLRMYELIIEKDRFYITMRQWVYYGVMGTIMAAMLWASYALHHHEEVEPWLKYPFMVCTALGLVSLFYDRNGKGGRKYGLRGKLVWGANARGLFLTALEERITEYDWARVKKIVVAEKMAVPNRSVVKGIYFGSDIDGNHNGTYKCDKRVIIFFDEINKSESRIGKLVHDNSAIRDATALPLTYGAAPTDDIVALLKKYAPKNIHIDVKAYWDLTHNG
jgi:hypothetical protein